MALYFVTAPHPIGDQEWRLVVKDSPLLAGERAFDYEFRPVGRPDDVWRGQNWWQGPLPGELARLFAEHSLQITQELNPGTYPMLPGLA